MSMITGRIRLPHMPEVSIRNGSDFDTPSLMQYDEVIFDPKTNRYLTLSQQEEIRHLKLQLEEKEKTKREKLESIIGYFYKSR